MRLHDFMKLFVECRFNYYKSFMKPLALILHLQTNTEFRIVQHLYYLPSNTITLQKQGRTPNIEIWLWIVAVPYAKVNLQTIKR
jgi:hypothetical protein